MWEKEVDYIWCDRKYLFINNHCDRPVVLGLIWSKNTNGLNGQINEENYYENIFLYWYGERYSIFS